MSANARTAQGIAAAAAFTFSMFIGALIGRAILAALIGTTIAATDGAPVSIAIVAAVIGLLVMAAIRFRRAWAWIVLAIYAGLFLGSLAPPMTGGR